MRRPVTGSRLQPRKPWENGIINAGMSRPVGRLSRYRSVLTAVVQNAILTAKRGVHLDLKRSINKRGLWQAGLIITNSCSGPLLPVPV